MAAGMPRLARRRRAAEIGLEPASTGSLAASETGHEQTYDSTGIASAEQRRERMIHVWRNGRGKGPAARVGARAVTVRSQRRFCRAHGVRRVVRTQR
ncbi:hypothetical protein BN2475_530066 [Paraburkholderia ribeironis]|uniref:Uncharacterized protein n=1 Tax=Paraburkholderia ribeironis TaxID=1247936 RepID=A0A1N7SDZ7_9BURK|nr:hypothetical protein BN2475_530066 [Paraburkholderia ribeironis]